MSSFKIVFRLELLHEYFTDEAVKDLVIAPSADTHMILRNYDMKWKQAGNFLFVAAKTDHTGSPQKPWPVDLKIVFYLLSKSSLFQNITNPSSIPLSKTTFWLSNFSKNKVQEVLPDGSTTIDRMHLSAPISTHINATTYHPGKLVLDSGTHEVYECLKSTASGILLANTSFWRRRGKKQYVTVADSQLLIAAPLLFTVSTPAFVFHIRWFGMDVNTGTFSRELRGADVQKFETLVSQVSVSFNGLPAGRCRVEVNGESIDVVIKDPSLMETPVAVIELYNHVAAAPDFSLLHAGVVSDKKFNIRFCNKSVLWKYIAKTTDVTAVNDSSSTLSFSNVVASNEFVSNTPYPLKEQPLKTISFTSAVHGAVNSLPNASPSFLSEVEVDGDLYSCSSIYLNH